MPKRVCGWERTSHTNVDFQHILCTFLPINSFILPSAELRSRTAQSSCKHGAKAWHRYSENDFHQKKTIGTFPQSLSRQPNNSPLLGGSTEPASSIVIPV